MGWFFDDDDKKDNRNDNNDSKSSSNWDRNDPNDDTGGDYGTRTQDRQTTRDTKSWGSPSFVNQ